MRKQAAAERKQAAAAKAALYDDSAQRRAHARLNLAREGVTGKANNEVRLRQAGVGDTSKS